MGMRKKYHNLKVRKLTHLPNGKKLKNKYCVAEGNKLVSTCRGVTKKKAKELLKYYEKAKTFVFV